MTKPKGEWKLIDPLMEEWRRTRDPRLYLAACILRLDKFDEKNVPPYLRDFWERCHWRVPILVAAIEEPHRPEQDDDKYIMEMVEEILRDYQNKTRQPLRDCVKPCVERTKGTMSDREAASRVAKRIYKKFAGNVANSEKALRNRLRT